MQITGIDELSRDIRKRMNLDAVKNIVKQNGAEMQMKMQRNAPVDTGNLKRSVTGSLSDGGMTFTAQPIAEYSGYVEYGTRFMNAKPYVRPAYNVQKEIFKRDLDKLVK